MSAFETRWRACQERVEQTLERRLPKSEDEPKRLHEAMRYACLDGGKRLRAMLVYSAGELFGVKAEILDTPACALEMIHAYSLVHDDLPAMDDDDLRRGKPTCHKAFGEAIAILAGDALQTLAFDILASDKTFKVKEHQRNTALARLAQASGSLGMAGGQAIDCEAMGQALKLCELEKMHRLKTGALIRAAVALGALCHEDIDTTSLNALDDYATSIGLAFQVADDILDATADTETLGQDSGSDEELNKPTYVSLLGIDGARKAATDWHLRALSSLDKLPGDTHLLAELANFLVNRHY
ncbi:MAG: (2E,6E)-farnesyl diphosphate synthase [Gammaproteobacteria bacterium]|nr:(2E,6E)-farnesyl diphosphate synthase [Gammaproteobacteria bacterium]